MGATEMTATRTARSGHGRITAAIVGMFAAMLLLAMPVSNAQAADAVGNPGNFTLTFATNGAGDGIRYSSSNITETRWPMNSFATPDGSALTLQITVAADGTFTVTNTPTFIEKTIHTNCLTGAFLCIGAPSGVRSTPQKHPNFAWGGSIDPATGFLQLNMPMRISNRQNSGSTISDCFLGSNTNPISIQAATDKANGVAYNFSTGTARVADAGFTTPGPTNAAGGAPSDNCTRTTNWDGQTMNLPSTDTWFRGNLTILNGANEPVKPWPVRPSFTATPDPVGEGDTVTLDASGSAIDNGLEPCPTPDVSEPDCGYRWDFDGDDIVDEVTNGPIVTTSYPDAGNYSPKLTIFDVEAKSDTFTGSVWVQEHPVTQIDTTPPSVTKETENAFTFSITNDLYGSQTSCSVDGAAFSDCDSGDIFEFVQADDTIGSHNFRVRATTPGGVVGPIDEYDFTIDRVKPRVTIAPASLPANPTNSTSANFTFTADKPNSTLECQLDGGSWVACGTNSTGSQSYTNLSQSSPNPIEAPNPHEFRIRATDEYGNVGGDGNPGGGGYDWDIDLTSPIPTFVDIPADPTNEVSPLITWSNNESVDDIQCRLSTNGVLAPWGDCDTLTSIQFTDMEDNQYAISITVKDIAGNWSNVVTHNWLLETVPPDLEITSSPPALAKRSMAQFLFDHEDGAHLACQLDSQPVQDPCPSGVKYQNLAEGAHVFTVTATDAATNFTTRSYAWSVKTAQPVVAIEESSVPASSSTVDTADFDLVTANGEAECRLDGAAWSPCDSNSGQSYEDLADGNHTFEVRAVDDYGNVSPIDAYSWLVVTAGPDVEFTSAPDEDTRHTTASFGFDVTSADANVTTECSLNGLDPFDCSDPASVVGLEDGAHNFTVTATDTAGIQGSDTYDWNVKAKIPGLGFDATPASISNSAAATFEFSSDEDPDVGYECKLDSDAWAGCDSPVSLSSLSQGNHTFSIRATDSVGNIATESYTWRVDTIAPTVTYGTKPPATTVDVAELISFTASESNVSFECKLDSGSFAACTSPTLLKNLAVGGHTFTVKATDEAGNTGADAVATWTIGAVAPSGGSGAQSSGVGDVAPAAVTPAGPVLNAAAPAATTVNKAKVAKVKARARKAKVRARIRAKVRAKARAKAKRAKARAKQRRARR